MKIASLLLLGTAMVASGSNDFREGCFECIEDMDEAKECLKICNRLPYDPNGDGTGTLEENGSILNECLDPSRSDSIEDIEDLQECCDMDKSCQRELDAAQDCVVECFDPCIKETALAYLDCVKDESNNDRRGSCNRQMCLDGFLEDLEEDVDYSGDIFDLKNIEKRIKTIDEEDLEDCELMEPFVTSVCDIGSDCCRACNTDLSSVVDCLINDIVIPFVAIELNTTIEECPIADQCDLAAPTGRHLNVVSEEELINKALNLPKQAMSKRNAQKEAMMKKADQKRVLEAEKTAEELVEECTNGMEMNTILYNISYAMNIYMECVALAGISVLPEEAESGANSVVGLLAATIATLVGGWIAM